jgi:hyperosmotically inducible protein
MRLKLGTAVGIGSLAALLSFSPSVFAQGSENPPAANSPSDMNAPKAGTENAPSTNSPSDMNAPKTRSEMSAPRTDMSAAQPSDASLTTKVKEALKSDQSTMNAKIHVSAKDGVVTLKGKVDSKATASHAEQTAASVAGVKSVNNRLRVSENG